MIKEKGLFFPFFQKDTEIYVLMFKAEMYNMKVNQLNQDIVKGDPKRRRTRNTIKRDMSGKYLLAQLVEYFSEVKKW